MISVALITEILGLKIYSVKQKNDSTFEYTFDSIGETRTITINIYQLVYQCKKWARNLGFDLYSACHGSCAISFGEYRGVWNNFPTDEFYVKDNEIEAIFLACEYVLALQKNEEK